MSKPFIDEFELRKIAAYKAISTLPSFNLFADQLTVQDIDAITKDYFCCTTCYQYLLKDEFAGFNMCRDCWDKLD